MTMLPASCRAPTTLAGGQPKVKLVTAGGSASSAATLPSNPSSSQLPSPSGPAERSELRYRSSAPGFVYAVPGTKTFTPKGSDVAARTAAISAAIAAGVLYPAARKPSAPAPAAAITSSVVDGPPAIGATMTGRRSRSGSLGEPSPGLRVDMFVDTTARPGAG